MKLILHGYALMTNASVIKIAWNLKKRSHTKKFIWQAGRIAQCYSFLPHKLKYLSLVSQQAHKKLCSVPINLALGRQREENPYSLLASQSSRIHKLWVQ